jgi:hypothetical protein
LQNLNNGNDWRGGSTESGNDRSNVVAPSTLLEVDRGNAEILLPEPQARGSRVGSGQECEGQTIVAEVEHHLIMNVIDDINDQGIRSALAMCMAAISSMNKSVNAAARGMLHSAPASHHWVVIVSAPDHGRMIPPSTLICFD